MCKILWKKWLKYFCWSDEASDSCWDDSESDTPDHSAGLGWAGLGADSTLSTILRLSLLHQNVHEIVSRLSLSTIKLPTLLSAIPVCIQPWFMISFIPLLSQSPVSWSPPSSPTFTSDTDGGHGAWGQLLHSPLMNIYLSSFSSNFAKNGCDFDRHILYPDEYIDNNILWSVLYLVYGHSNDSITLIS